MSKVVFLLGRPCSGKGTIGHLLKDYEFIHISAGQLLREKFPVGTKERNKLDKGELIDINTTNNCIKEMLGKKQGLVILDGYPRTPEQAQFALTIPRVQCVVVLDCPKEELYRRVRMRRYCPYCDRTFAKNLVCCGKQVIRRGDDTIDILNNRLNVYDSNINQVLDILNKYPIYTVNSNQSVEQVKQDVLNSICLSIV